MIQFTKLKKELKKGIYETLRDALFEVLKINGENVIIFKQLKITYRKTSSGDIYHIRDITDPQYPEINNIYLLDILYKAIINETQSEKTPKTTRTNSCVETK